MKPYTFHPAADAEYTEAAKCDAGIGVKLAGRFHDDDEQVLRRVCRQPGRFRRGPPLVRRALCNRFPRAVLYVHQPDRSCKRRRNQLSPMPFGC